MLSDLRVVGLDRAVAAPLCTRILADWGADVIKVEQPPAGDFSRGWDDYVGGESSYFVLLNRGKRSLCIDLSQPRGRDALLGVLASADVFVHNLTRRALHKLELEPETLHERLPRLVICSIWGYGSRGPYTTRKAYDMLVQGETGLEAMTGPAGQPSRLGIPVADLGAGVYAALSILAGLHARSVDGVGRVMEVSLFETMLDWIAQPLAQWVNAGVAFKRSGLAHHLLVPYAAFMTRDRVLVNITCQQDSEWRSLCQQLQRPELADEPRFATFELRRAAQAEVEAELAALIRTLDAAELERRLDDGGIAHGRVRSVEEVARHPQLEALGLLEDHGFGTLVGPVLTGARADRPPPALGEHNLEILSAAGCSPAEVRDLAADGILIPATGP